jgi:ribose transport system permease protein
MTERQRMDSIKAESLNVGEKQKRSISDMLILVIFLIGFFLLFSFISPNFFTYANLSTMLNNMVITGMVAVAITPLIVARGLDISFGASLALSTVIMALLYNRGVNLYIILVLGFVLPIVITFINGLLAEYFRLIPLILTLGTMFIILAISQVLTDGRSIPMLVEPLYYFGTKSFYRIPYPIFALLAVIAVYWYILTLTKFGKKIYIVGANPVAARLSGLKVRQIKILLYVYLGIVTGMASIIMIALSGVGYAYHGEGLILPVLSAVFLGGMSLAGGEGSIWKTLLGAVIITVIFSGLSLMSVQFYFIQILQGLALVTIVAFYEIRKKRRELKA